ncbi:MAG: hypothetical protein O9302_00185 [Cyclobacteriaceae bacterium]|jgi:hypothetical protein|nr:hypothetical protein [Cytophagales bacterium]MCZ8326448.1 hypothetical protein [Cyclobacteriaceae bacterium]
MTSIETLIAKKKLLQQRIKAQRKHVSAHQLRIWRERVKRYSYVISLFDKSNRNNNQLTLV